MIKPASWTARSFRFDCPVDTFPEVLERLRGTPARARELVTDIADELLSLRIGGRWSAKENLGHLSDLVPLEETRLQEFLSGAPVLSAADMSNRATEEAEHNLSLASDVLSELRRHRAAFVAKLEGLSQADVSRSALHPRLKQPMRIVDWAYFLAEHDDHHLAAARYALWLAGKRQG